MTKTILHSRWILIIGSALSILLLALLIGTTARQAKAASAAATYAVTWYTADNGGGISSGGGYEVAGTTGQMDAASGATSAGYGLDGGFWTAWPNWFYEVFLPAVMK